MDASKEQWTFSEGIEVVDADGEMVGAVIAVHPNAVVVQQGLFLPIDHSIPTTALATYDGERITLNVTKAAALDQGWDTVPADGAATITTPETTTTDANTTATET